MCKLQRGRFLFSSGVDIYQTLATHTLKAMRVRRRTLDRWWAYEVEWCQKRSSDWTEIEAAITAWKKETLWVFSPYGIQSVELMKGTKAEAEADTKHSCRMLLIAMVSSCPPVNP